MEETQAAVEAVVKEIIPKEVLKGIGAVLSSSYMKMVITILLCLVVAKLLLSIINHALERSKLEQTMQKFAKNVVKVIVYGIAVLIIADTFGIEISSLVAMFSVVGAALALAAQNTLGNFFGGMLLMISQPFLVGDYVSTAAGEGTVLEVGLLNTKMQTPDNRIVQVPNGVISGDTVTNFTKAGTRRLDLDFTVSYDADMEQVKALMQEVMCQHPNVLSEPEAPFARVTNYGESNVTYTARVWVTCDNYWVTRFDLLENIKKKFDENGVEIPYNHINVHML